MQETYGAIVIVEPAADFLRSREKAASLGGRIQVIVIFCKQPRYSRVQFLARSY